MACLLINHCFGNLGFSNVILRSDDEESMRMPAERKPQVKEPALSQPITLPCGGLDDIFETAINRKNLN